MQTFGYPTQLSKLHGNFSWKLTFFNAYLRFPRILKENGLVMNVGGNKYMILKTKQRKVFPCLKIDVKLSKYCALLNAKLFPNKT